MSNTGSCSRCILLSSLLVLQTCRVAAQLRRDEEERVFLRGLPHSDREFIMKYLDFVKSKDETFFLPIGVTLIVIGLIGNSCFFYFFGNKRARAFHSRDAIFIRRMSISDFLICAVVLPYAILFESKLIKHNLLCKMLEFVRHVLSYISHLLLTSYSIEFTTPENYFIMKAKLNRIILYIIAFSVVISTPTLFIFEVGTYMDFNYLLEQNVSQVESILLLPVPAPPEFESLIEGGNKPVNRYLFFKPEFCHLNLNYDTKAKYFQAIKILQTIHVMLNGLVFLVCVVMLVSKIMNIMDSKPARENSLVEHIIEQNNPDLAEKLKKIREFEKERKRKRRMERLSLKVMHPSMVAGSVELNNQMAGTTQKNPSISDLTLSSIIAVKDIKVPKGNNFSGKNFSKELGSSREHSSQEKSDSGNAGFTSKFESSVDYEPSVKQIVHEVKVAREESSEELPEDPTVSLMGFCCGCECLRSNPRSIRKLGGTEGVSPLNSYRVPILVLTALDLLMLCAAAVGYVISNERSVVLNLIHLKSVFGFYIISVLQKELFLAIWGQSCCYRETSSMESATVSQVSSAYPGKKGSAN